MDSLAFNKALAAVLVAGIAFFGVTQLSDDLVHPTKLSQQAIKIDTGAPGVVVAAAAADAPPAPIGPLLAKADPAAGEAFAKKVCAACHTFAEGAKAGVGPNLYNVVGGKHGHMDGYAYSTGMQAKAGNWTFDDLNVWLSNPRGFVQGTKMSYAGIKDDQTRANVIAYLRTLSGSPVALPQ